MKGASNDPALPAVRAKSAAVNMREYDEAMMHKKFVTLSASIHEREEHILGFNPADVTPRSLSLLTGNLRAFVETALGRGRDRSFRQITKFPHRLFFDYKPKGSLDIMLCACLNFKALHGLRRLEFNNVDKRSFYFELLARIERELSEANLLPIVRVCFAESLPTSEHAVLKNIVEKRGKMVTRPTEATHIIYPDPDGTTASETEAHDYCRTLQLTDKFALVHWWYYPDSYDSWIAREDVSGDPEPDDELQSPWHVQLRWLHDTEAFNEWMNEIDYEIPDEQRMKIVPSAGSPPPPEPEKSQPIEEKDKRERSSDVMPVKLKVTKPDEKASKKRKRTMSASSSKHGPESLPTPRADRAVVTTPSDDSEEERIRKPKRHADRGSNKDSIMKIRKDFADGGHVRKKARMGDTKRAVRVLSGPSIKLRLPIKPRPHERRERHKDRKSHQDSTMRDVRDVSGESGELKVVLKASKLVLGKHRGTEELPEQKTSNQDSARDSENDNVSSAVLKPSTSKSRDVKSSPIGKGKGDTQRLATDSSLKRRHSRQGDGEDGTAEDGVHDPKKPFSRRRSKKKEKRHRVQGLTVVEDAVPIPEGEVPRIHNISNNANAVTDMKISSESENEQEDSKDGRAENGERNDSFSKTGEAARVPGTDPMDIDTRKDKQRIMAVSEKMLAGHAANAPVGEADLVQSLPTIKIRMPAHARWFRKDSINDIERRSLTEFFNSRGESKTPVVYKKYRDFMIDVWRQNPDKYLTATAARRHLAGDVCAILRVHAFLEYWGLINYGVVPESRPLLNSSVRPAQLRATTMQLDAPMRAQGNGVPRSLFFDDPLPAARENAPVTLQKAMQEAKEKKSRNPILSRRELYALAAATKYECDACGCDCSKIRYHCVGNADMDLCPKCFANGQYPPTLSTRDFEQLTTVHSSEAYDGKVWSEVEVLLLLEGLEKFGDNWNQVAEHVRTKDADECVLQFLRMPIEDSFLEDQVGKWKTGGVSAQGDVEVSQDECMPGDKFTGPLLPFYDTSNPLMAQVAFLAASVDQEVAAAAAHAALNKMMSQSGHSSNCEDDKGAQAKALLKSRDEKSKNPDAPNGSPKTVENGGTQGTAKLEFLSNKEMNAVSLEAASAVGLAAAVAKAQEISERELREIERHFGVMVETKLRQVDLKLKEFEGLEVHTRKERERLEKQRQLIFAERVESSVSRIRQEVHGTGALSIQHGLANVGQHSAGGTGAISRTGTGQAAVGEIGGALGVPSRSAGDPLHSAVNLRLPGSLPSAHGAPAQYAMHGQGVMNIRSGLAHGQTPGVKALTNTGIAPRTQGFATGRLPPSGSLGPSNVPEISMGTQPPHALPVAPAHQRSGAGTFQQDVGLAMSQAQGMAVAHQHQATLAAQPPSAAAQKALLVQQQRAAMAAAHQVRFASQQQTNMVSQQQTTPGSNPQQTVAVALQGDNDISPAVIGGGAPQQTAGTTQPPLK